MFTRHVDHDPSLGNCQAERFLDVNVFAGLAGFDRNVGVPVIRRGHNHRVDIIAVEDAAKVLRVQVRLLVRPADDFIAGLFDLGLVDVTERHALDVLESKSVAQIASPHTSAADQSDSNAVIGTDDARR